MAIQVLASEHPEEVRFAALRRRMPGVAAKMLSQTLRSLERDGLVVRRVEPNVPPSVFYTVTPLGRSLEHPLSALRTWAEEHMTEIKHAGAAYDDATG